MARRAKAKKKRVYEKRRDVTGEICLDCKLHQTSATLSSSHPEYCVHFTPEFWAEQGYERDWGDAAVMNWPYLEILRQQTAQDCRFVVLAPHSQRRPVELYTSDPGAWGPTNGYGRRRGMRACHSWRAVVFES
jgi:hypothetical protein